MTYRYLLSLPILTLCLFSAACQSPPSEAPDSAPAATQEAGQETAAAESSEAVEFEPAYPTDVSDEGLDEHDVSQQGAAHSHDEEGHSHGDGEHSHDEGEEHDDSDHKH